MTKSQKKHNVHILGKGEKTMLFVHGYGCDQNMWRFITPAFETSYKIVLIDLVGSGQSGNSVADVSIRVVVSEHGLTRDTIADAMRL